MATATRAQQSGGRPTGQQKARPPAPAPTPASPAVKAALKSGAPGVTLDGAAAAAIDGKVAAGEIDLSTGELVVPEAAAAAVKSGEDLSLDVRLPGLAAGTLKVRKRGETFATVGADQAILLRHPALARFAATTPTVLVLDVKENKVGGWVGLGSPGPARGNPRALFDALGKGAELLGWAGLSKITFPPFRNRFEAGVIDVGVENLAFTVGGFLTGAGAMALDNKALSFEGSAKIQIPGGSGGELLIKKDPTGALSGKLDMLVQIGSVAGTVTATLSRGFVSVMGSVAYSSDRLSGKVTLVATDEATARDITLLKPQAGGDVPIELPGPDKPAKPGKRAYCGWGQLTFRVTDWLAGTATVIVNSKGQATIVGEIAPPKEFVLFPQKEWIKKIFKLEIRAGYGIPVVGQVGLFANIGLDAIAKVGPGKLYNIKLAGAYSTDPRVAKQLSIEATLNISAFAGLRLRAEAGLVVTILGHDIKAGVGLNAIAGVRGYVEATPRIGMRELAPGKPQYYIQGHLEIAAQPVLGFSGDLFVAIETPWWSPLSDKRWTWPLFSIEYPLPGEFGIGADVDYVLGSKQWPTIEFGEVDFDSSKFLTDVMNDNTDSGSGGEEKKQGDWLEGKGGKGPGGARNKGGSGKKPGELGSDSEPVGESLSFSDGHEPHRLWFAEKPGEAKLMVASAEDTVPQRLDKLDKQVDQLLEGDRAGARTLIAKARALLPKIQDEAKQVSAMKEAERKAEETYKKHGKKKGPKGKKADRKAKNKQLKKDERQLQAVLKDLFSLMRMEPWKTLKKPATWSSRLRGKTIKGGAPIDIVGGGKTAALQLGKSRGVGALDAILGGPLGATKNPAGRNETTAAKKAIAKELKTLEKVPIAGDKIQTRANVELGKIIERLPPVIEKLGTTLKVSSLAAATKKSRKPARKVVFNVNRTPAKKYQATFEREMKTQLKDQETGLNLLTVDTWVVRIDTYKAKFRKEFEKLDKNARAAVAAEIRAKLVETEPVPGEEIKLLTIARETLDKFLKGKGDGKQLKGKQKRYLRWLEYSVKLAEKIGPAREKLAKFLAKHPDLAKLSKAEREELVTLGVESRMVGRSDQEKEFERLHQEGIQEVAKTKSVAGLWTGWSTGSKRAYALLHNPDQVAGGHGSIADITPVKKPKQPVGASQVDQAKYDEELKAWNTYLADLSKFVGNSLVNSIIGGGWGNKIPDLKEEIIGPENYHAPLYGLWLLNFKLSHLFKSK